MITRADLAPVEPLDPALFEQIDGRLTETLWPVWLAIRAAFPNVDVEQMGDVWRETANDVAELAALDRYRRRLEPP